MSAGDKFGIAAAAASRLFPDHHVFAINIYAGKSMMLSTEEWSSLYKEMMEKPTGVSKEQWHLKFIALNGEK